MMAVGVFHNNGVHADANNTVPPLHHVAFVHDMDIITFQKERSLTPLVRRVHKSIELERRWRRWWRRNRRRLGWRWFGTENLACKRIRRVLRRRGQRLRVRRSGRKFKQAPVRSFDL